MIAYIKGKLAYIGAGWVVVDVNGIGYRLYIPAMTKLPSTGQEVQFYTHMAVREDGIQIYGFLQEEELECFLALLDVAGVGPKVALAVVAHLPPGVFKGIIASGNVNQLVKVPGVGKKTAQRIMLELKDKLRGPAALPEPSETITPAPGRIEDDAVVALLSLGYAQNEAREAVRQAMGLGLTGDVSALIKAALKELAPAK
ncbi:Holliday junction ATP-dependent DNA helicase ruvA [Desulfotomaculum nigrificans CO-1-SRB]|uniref:Holliday junction branch migration complex subunit RuvA n=1 Tax=Desulfotomaculum nigrificans (strain DSM 14880 / VKM B-2319 / CO-1-SRB) TaxID=868595 RepID=F6B443_DESCC|nr:Holliday junction branch migration protein RuvA [Desulfotomaculum nigrificans]AEF94098.1 Holliday junction ATP-dependent DNA helicase ruvA [Desulfotomaculum nigrificans CO-1-SRB]